MASEWTTSDLAELTVNYDGKRRPVKETERRAGPYPYYGASGVVDHVEGYLFDGDYLLIAEDGENLRTRQTPIAFMARGKFWVNNHAHIVTGNEKADTRFLMYALQHADISGYLTGAVMPKLTQGNLNRIELSHPCVSGQRAIAHVLGTLDDKIELNRRRNQTLEAMARAIFRDWFVDFGPVRAKMEAREPYLPADLWQLFPDRLDDEGKPEGWQARRLDDALILQRGFDLPASGRTHGAYPVMAASGLNGYHNQFMVKGPGITTGRSGVLGRVFYVHTDFWPLNTSLWVKEFKSVSPLYAFELLRGLDFEMFNAGSAVPTLNRNHVHNLPIVLPPKQLIDTFDEQVSPMREAQKHCEDECGFLAQLRDTLLPKLISGELRIKNAERFLAETV